MNVSPINYNPQPNFRGYLKPVVKASSIAIGSLAAYQTAKKFSDDDCYYQYHSSAYDVCMSDEERRIEAAGGIEAIEAREREERIRKYREMHPGIGGSDTTEAMNL